MLRFIFCLIDLDRNSTAPVTDSLEPHVLGRGSGSLPTQTWGFRSFPSWMQDGRQGTQGLGLRTPFVSTGVEGSKEDHGQTWLQSRPLAHAAHVNPSRCGHRPTEVPGLPSTPHRGRDGTQDTGAQGPWCSAWCARPHVLQNIL